MKLDLCCAICNREIRLFTSPNRESEAMLFVLRSDGSATEDYCKIWMCRPCYNRLKNESLSRQEIRANISKLIYES